MGVFVLAWVCGCLRFLIGVDSSIVIGVCLAVEVVLDRIGVGGGRAEGFLPMCEVGGAIGR